MVFIFALWSTKYLYPLKMLTVFFHEASHAIAAVLTGGKVTAFELNPNQSGLVRSQGGSQFWLSTSGYLGSCLWGSLIYLSAARSKLDRWVLGLLGLIMVFIPLYFGGNDYSRWFGIFGGLATMITAYFLPVPICDLILRVTGLTSMSYAVLDIQYDVLTRTDRRSDAVILADNLGGSAIMWGVIWIALSLLVIALTIKFSFRKPSSNKKAKATS